MLSVVGGNVCVYLCGHFGIKDHTRSFTRVVQQQVGAACRDPVVVPGQLELDSSFEGLLEVFWEPRTLDVALLAVGSYLWALSICCGRRSVRAAPEQAQQPHLERRPTKNPVLESDGPHG